MRKLGINSLTLYGPAFSENIEEDVETKFEVLTIQQIFGLISVNQAEAELRIVDPSDFSTFCSKDHPKPF